MNEVAQLSTTESIQPVNSLDYLLRRKVLLRSSDSGWILNLQSFKFGWTIFSDHIRQFKMCVLSVGGEAVMCVSHFRLNLILPPTTPSKKMEDVLGGRGRGSKVILRKIT